MAGQPPDLEILATWPSVSEITQSPCRENCLFPKFCCDTSIYSKVLDFSEFNCVSRETKAFRRGTLFCPLGVRALPGTHEVCVSKGF
jgi:hypothetical protein